MNALTLHIYKYKVIHITKWKEMKHSPSLSICPNRLQNNCHISSYKEMTC